MTPCRDIRYYISFNLFYLMINTLKELISLETIIISHMIIQYSGGIFKVKNVKSN